MTIGQRPVPPLPMERLSADTLRLLLDTMVEGVVLHDSSGDVVWANPSAARILGSSVLLSVRTSGAHAAHWHAVREDGSELDAHPRSTRDPPTIASRPSAKRTQALPLPS